MLVLMGCNERPIIIRGFHRLAACAHRFQMSNQSSSLYVERVPIRWGDMDAMNHVNNTIYFRYMEQARIAWMDARGWSADQRYGPILGKVSCKFIRPLVYPGTATVDLVVSRIGRSTFETHHRIMRDDDPSTVFAEGDATMVWIDLVQFKAVELPETVRAQLQRELA